MKKVIVFVLCVVALTASGQKPEKVKHVGKYNNIAQYTFPINGFKTTNIVSTYYSDMLDKMKCNLNLKGFETGNGLSILFYGKDPEIVATVKTYNTTIDSKNISKYYTSISAKSESKVFILNELKELIKILEPNPNYHFVTKDGTYRDTKQEAQKELSKNIEKEQSGAKRTYINALAGDYQNQLDNLYGNFYREEKFRLFKIKPKKFNYDDFNEAVDNFMISTDTSNQVISEENLTQISNSIQVWENYVKEYSPGKKTRVSDANVDEIYYNLCLGYLVLGDGINLNKYWTLAQNTKGNTTTESYAKRYIPQMLTNFDIAQNEKGSEPIKMELKTKTEQYNEMLISKLFMNLYLTTKHGNLSIVNNYFPSNPLFLKTVKNKATYNEGTSEEVSLSYEPFGKISGMEYKVFGTLDGDKSYNFEFVYNDTLLDKITRNSNLLYKAHYDDSNKLIALTQRVNSSKRIEYEFKDDGNGNININYIYFAGDKESKGRRPYSISYTEDFKITSIRFERFFTKQIVYDKYGNITEVHFSNAADMPAELKPELTIDGQGNVIESISEGINKKVQLNYIF